MSLSSSALRIIAAAVVLTVAAAATNRSAHRAPPFRIANAISPCRPGKESPFAGARITDGEVVMRNTGAIRLLACGPSWLSFGAYSTKPQGAYARIVVSAGSRPLVNTRIKGRKRFSIFIPSAGWLLITFPNQLHDPSANRILTLRNITLQPSD